MDLLIKLARELNLTLLVVTHDQKVASRFSNIVTISDGEVGGEAG